MRILIADDEPLALRRLETAVSCIPEAEIVAVAANGRDARRLIASQRPDVAILDIEMPGQSGLEIVEQIGPDDHMPEVIFATAFRHYAVRAFDLAAVDYLTKPIAFERLRDAVRRARFRLDARSADQRFADMQALVATLQAGAPDGGGHDTHIWIRRRDEMVRLPVGLIQQIEAQGDYVMLHTADGAVLHRATVQSLEEKLDPSTFVRCHRSMMINLDHVRAVRRRGAKGLSLSLADGRSVDVGPTYVDRLLASTRLKRWRF